MPKAKLRTQAVCESSSSQESLSTPFVKDNLRSRIEQKLVQQNEERFSKSQDNATLWNSLFYSSQCHIRHVSTTRENEAGVDLCYISLSVFGEIRTWAVKLFDFHGKWMVLAEISLIFMIKRKESSVPLLVVQIHFMAPMVCPQAFTSSSLCTEACIFANNLSICPYFILCEL